MSIWFETWTPTDWVAVLSGILYVWLAARGNRWCWAFGILSCAVIAREDFVRLKLYSDGILQIFYIIMGVAGLYYWRSDRGIRVRPLQALSFHLVIILGTLVASLPISWLFLRYTDAAFPFLDAWTTLLSLTATWMTVRMMLENWWYWILADLIYVYLYIQRDAPAFAWLFVIYTLVSIYGWIHWRKLSRNGPVI